MGNAMQEGSQVDPAKPRGLLFRPGVGSAIAVAFGAIIGVAVLAAASDAILPEPPATILLPTPVEIDAIDDPSISSAEFNVQLVHWGTSEPFTGNGPPGLQLSAKTQGDVVQWSLEGWANETTPPPYRVCSEDSVHFDVYDWTWRADGYGNDGRGTFVSTPSQVPQRQSTSGDQCLMRVAATGSWTATVCIEGKPGGALGYHADEDGGIHFDGWDKCVLRVFQVG